MNFKNWLEVSSENLAKIGARVNQYSRKEYETMPFNNIFGNKYRIVIPLGKDEETKFVASLEKLGYTLDLKQGTAKQTIQTQRGPKEKVQRIGKLIQNLARNDKENTQWADLLRWWEKNKENINKQSDIGVSVVISRHPIDILRMSDHSEWSSCHSVGGSFYRCAIQEAKTGGAVAYVVRTKDLSKVKNLQAKDIFKDKDRDINGIEPLERIRLRRLISSKGELLIPELRTYGTGHVGLYDTVKTWLKTVQKDVIDKNIPYKSFDLKGGSYKDNSVNKMWNKFFDSEDETKDKKSLDQGEESRKGVGDIDDLAQEIVDNHEYKHFSLFYDVIEEIDETFITFSAETSFSYPIYDWNKEKMQELLLNNISRETAFKNIKEEASFYVGTFIHVQEHRGTIVFSVDWDAEEYGSYIEDFERFADDIYREDQQYDEYYNDIRKALISLGYIKKVDANKYKFSNFQVQWDEAEDLEIISKYMPMGVIDQDFLKSYKWKKEPTPNKPVEFSERSATMSIFEKLEKQLYDLRVVYIVDNNYNIYLQIRGWLKPNEVTYKVLSTIKFIDTHWNYFTQRAAMWLQRLKKEPPKFYPKYDLGKIRNPNIKSYREWLDFISQ